MLKRFFTCFKHQGLGGGLVAINFIFPEILGCCHPNWRRPSFFGTGWPNHQPFQGFRGILMDVDGFWWIFPSRDHQTGQSHVFLLLEFIKTDVRRETKKKLDWWYWCWFSWYVILLDHQTWDEKDWSQFDKCWFVMDSTRVWRFGLMFWNQATLLDPPAMKTWLAGKYPKWRFQLKSRRTKWLIFQAMFDSSARIYDDIWGWIKTHYAILGWINMNKNPAILVWAEGCQLTQFAIVIHRRDYPSRWVSARKPLFEEDMRVSNERNYQYDCVCSLNLRCWHLVVIPVFQDGLIELYCTMSYIILWYGPSYSMKLHMVF